MTSTGYGDIHASTTGQHIVAALCMLIGQILFGTALATVAAMLGNSMTTRVEATGRLAALKIFLRDHHVGADLCHRVESYLEQHWARFQGHVNFEHIEGMPKSLQSELCSAQYSRLLENFPLFNRTVPDFTRDLSGLVKRVLVLPGENVIQKGDIGKEMYFVLKGSVAILSADDSKIVQQLTSGDHFGEAGLLFRKPRLNSVRAATYCELLVLKEEDLIHAAMQYPAILQLIRHVRKNDAHYSAISSAVAMNEAIAFQPSYGLGSNWFQHSSTFVRTRREYRSSVRNRISPLSSGRPSVSDAPPTDSTTPSNYSCCQTAGEIAAGCCSFLIPWTIMPTSAIAQNWEGAMLLLSTFTSVSVWIQAAFAYESAPFLVFHYLVDLFLLLDAVLKLHTAFFDSRGILITDSRFTARRFFQTTFWIDAVASFPLELLALGLPGNTLRNVCLLRVNRSLRFYRVLSYLQYLEKNIRRSMGRLRMVKFSIVITVITNFVACVWFILGCFDDCSTDSWTGFEQSSHISRIQNVSVADMSRGSQYLTSLYWATASMASVGYGDIHAHTPGEKAYSALVMLFGVAVYGYFIASVTATLANSDFDRSRFREKHDFLQKMLSGHNVDPDVSARVAQHFEYAWTRNRGMQAHALFKELDLPLSLQADLCMDVYEGAIAKVPLFQNTGVGFTRLLSLTMRPSLHLKGDYVVRKGDFGQEMFFIHTGSIEVVSDDGTEVFAVMNAGAFFGEISLVFSCPRTASIRARTNCDLFVLNKQDLDHVLLSFPDISKRIKSEAEARFVQVKARNRDSSPGSPGGLDRTSTTKPERGLSNSLDSVESAESTITTSGPAATEVCEASSFYGGVCITVTTEVVDSDAPKAWNGAIVAEDHMPTGDGDNGVNDDSSGAVHHPRSNAPIVMPSASQIDAAIDIEDLIGSDDENEVKPCEDTTPAESTLDSSTAFTSSAERRSSGESVRDSDGRVEPTAPVAPKTSGSESASQPKPGGSGAADDGKQPSHGRLINTLMLCNYPFSTLMRKIGQPVIMPKTRLSRILETLFLLCAAMWCFTNPYEAAFFKDGVDFSVMNCVFEVIFWIEIELNFHTAIIGGDGEPILDLGTIAEDYVRGGRFARDALTAFPLDMLAMLVDPSRKYARVISLIRMIRVLRFSTVNQYFATRERELHTEIVLLRTLKFTIIVSFTTHLVACIWYLIACPNGGCTSASWVSVEELNAAQFGPGRRYTASLQYCDSLYWAMATMTSVGYGDVHAGTDAERAFSIVAIIAGKLLYSFVLGNIASTLANADYLRVNYKEKLAAIDETLMDRSIKVDLRKKVQRYHEHIWNVQHGLATSELLREMPYTLRTDVSWNLGEDLLRQVPMFQFGDSGFVAMLAMSLKPEFFLKGDFVHKDGDVCREVTFVVAGYVEMTHGDRIVQIKHPRSYFGEFGMIAGKPYNSSFRAATHLETLVLSASDFFNTLQHFPEMKDSIEAKVGMKFPAKATNFFEDPVATDFP